MPIPLVVITGIVRDAQTNTRPLRQTARAAAMVIVQRIPPVSRRTKTVPIFGIVRRKTNTTRQMTFVPQRIRIAGIARTKRVVRLTTSARRARTPGTATDVKQNMLWTRLVPTATCIVRTKVAKRF